MVTSDTASRHVETNRFENNQSILRVLSSVLEVMNEPSRLFKRHEFTQLFNEP